MRHAVLLALAVTCFSGARSGCAAAAHLTIEQLAPPHNLAPAALLAGGAAVLKDKIVSGAWGTRTMPTAVNWLAGWTAVRDDDDDDDDDDDGDLPAQAMALIGITSFKSDDGDKESNWPTKCWAPDGSFDSSALSRRTVPCGGHEQQCGPPHQESDGPLFHITDSSCGINDPNGAPSF